MNTAWIKALVGVVFVSTMWVAVADQNPDTLKDEQPVPLTAGQIIGKKVQDVNGKDVGEIDQLIVNPRTGSVTHVVLSRGGFMDIGDDLIPVPWAVLRIGSDFLSSPGTVPLKLSVDEARLLKAPKINKTNLVSDATHYPNSGGDSSPLSQSNNYFKAEIAQARSHSNWKMDEHGKKDKDTKDK